MSLLTRAFDNGVLRFSIVESLYSGQRAYATSGIEVATPSGWHSLLEGLPGLEFVTSIGSRSAHTCDVRRTTDGGWEVTMSGRGEGWEAREVITLATGQPFIRRTQSYRFMESCDLAICPGFRLLASDDLRYTFPLRAHEQALSDLPPMRSAVDWALPFPFHVWHNRDFVAMYGLDKRTSPGTLDFQAVGADGYAGLRVYYPDTCEFGQEVIPASTAVPGTAKFAPGTEITLTEIIAANPLPEGEEPLLEAELLAATLLLREPPRRADMKAVASGIVDFYEHCELWEPDALGPGRGWFSNMWVRTQTGPAKKRGEMSGYFDLGWGEGIAVEMWMGALRHWKRTGDTTLLPYVDEMTRNMKLFKRGDEPDAPYFDRSDGTRFGDFLMDLVPGSRLWTHSLGHTGSQLIQLYQLAPDYPNPATRDEWLVGATSIARFLAKHHRANGDLQDIFDENDQEVNLKPHRITARAVVCGLWTRLAQVTGEEAWTDRALRLSKAVAPEINRYEYYNQMLDGVASPGEFVDGEAAYYVLEGLTPLYAATRDDEVLALCRKAAAFGILWTYFYELPQAHNGIARGGQCCRMPDYPLLYPIGPAKAIEPLLALHAATGDPLFEKMAFEMATFIGNYQMHAPRQPWDGGIIHALGQYCDKHWGPGLTGQVDTGMATGNGLAAIELWMEHEYDLP